jgi:hypothetical protein
MTGDEFYKCLNLVVLAGKSSGARINQLLTGVAQETWQKADTPPIPFPLSSAEFNAFIF